MAGSPVATDGEGRATLHGLAPGFPYRLRVERSEWPAALSAPFVAGGSVVPTLDVHLVAGRTIEVRVMDEGGRALAGVSVLAAVHSAPARRGPRRAVYVTDSAGRTRVGPCPEGVVRVSAEAAGFARSTADVVAHATEATLTLERAGTISGTVTEPDGTPADGTTIYVRGSAAAPIDRIASALADGSFTLDGLPPGLHTLEAMGTRKGGWLQARAVASVGATDVRLVLASPQPTAAGKFELRVLGADGALVPLAMGVVRRGRGGEGGFHVVDGIAHPTMDDTDTATIVVWGARTAAGVLLPYGSTSRTLSTLPRDGLEVRLAPERVAEGIVVDSSGRGISGATLTAVPGASTGFERLNRSWAIAIAHSDEAGRFRLAGLGDEEMPVLISPPLGYLVPRELVVRGGETNVRFELRTATPVRITVIDGNGTPVPFATLIVAPAVDSSGPAGMDTPRRVTAADLLRWWTAFDGTATLTGLDPKIPVRLTIEPPRTASLRPVTMEKWHPRDETVRVASGALVRGIVVDGGGTPIQGAQVHLRDAAGKSSTVPTNVRGQFEFAGLEPGPCDVWATPDGGADTRAPKQRVTHDATNLRLILEGAQTFDVKIQNVPRDLIGQTAQLAAEDATPEGFTHARRGQIGSDGTVRFLAVRTDLSYTLWIPPSTDGRVLLRRGVRFAREGLSVSLVPGRSVSGRLRLAPGYRQPSVHLAVESFERISGRLDAEGRFHIDGVPEGRWRLSYTAFRDGSGQWYSVEVEAGATVDLEVPPPER